MDARLIVGMALGLLVWTAPARAQTVGQLADAAHGCTGNSTLRPLAQQLARAQSCMYPSDLVEIVAGSGMTISGGSIPYATPQTRDALYATRRSVSFNINSAFRTLVEQYYLYSARNPACGSVATPGSSNHESGSAVDIQQYGAVRSAMQANGCNWPNYSNDPWHYDCRSAPRRTVLVFQRLWNLNNPGDRIDEDGSWGPQTMARLRATPAAGFANDGCGPPPVDCSNGRGDADVCGVGLLNEQAGTYAAPRASDVDGDGRHDVCARGASGVRCWTSTGTGWNESIAATSWSDASGWNDVSNYATLRLGDVNGDGLADVCARANSDFLCALSTGSGFAEATVWAAGLSDASGWNQPQRYTSIRLADVNGDGRDDLCALDGAGFGCWLSNGSSFATRVEGPRWSDAAGFTLAKFYGTLRMGDLDGDRRADVCIRGASGVQCVLSDGTSFERSIGGPAWSDAAGFGGREYWSTMRLADVDGDGRSDLCIRTSTDLRCVMSTGEGFGETRIVGALSDANGWADPSNYATIRVGDVDGDGADEICARGDADVGCWDWNGEAFVQHAGPAWSDASGWNAATHYQTIRLADVDGDGLDDICARTSAGWRCHRSRGEGFEDVVLALDEMTDAGGWAAPQYASTILSAGRSCRAEMEMCNGADDDCDGLVDEHVVTESCNGVDDDCDGLIDEGLGCGDADAAVPGRDAGPSTSSDGGRPDDGTLVAGCGCRVPTGARGGSSALMLIGALGVLLAWRRRRG